MAAIGRKAVKPLGNRSDPAIGCRSTQFGQWEIRRRVLGCRVLAINGDVRDAQVVIFCRVTGIDGIELGCGIVGSFGALITLIRLIRCRGRNDRQPTS